MAHFAKIDTNNTVLEVICVNNNDCGGGNFPESEPIGQTFLESLGLSGPWLQTSYHGNFRGIYAGIGWTYDPQNDIFVAPPAPEIQA